MGDMEDLTLRGQRMKALAEADLPATEWDEHFIRDVCRRAPGALSARQRAMVAVLCWRYREHLPAELVPDAEAKPMRPRP